MLILLISSNFILFKSISLLFGDEANIFLNLPLDYGLSSDLLDWLAFDLPSLFYDKTGVFIYEDPNLWEGFLLYLSRKSIYKDVNWLYG